jgi:uncharacterized damage-inducible protein DinB
MNEVLLEAFRHNAWATKELLRFCTAEEAARIDASTTGAYGTIAQTFNHLVASEAGYARRCTGTEVAWFGDEHADLETLDARADELLRLWETTLTDQVDGTKKVLLDQGTYETHMSIIWAQALHHGTLHREQICSILTSLGLEPPDLQVWAYADATGRSTIKPA